MKAIKIMLFGIAVILLGMAIGSMNFLAWFGGGIGTLIASAGLFIGDKH